MPDIRVTKGFTNLIILGFGEANILTTTNDVAGWSLIAEPHQYVYSLFSTEAIISDFQ